MLDATPDWIKQRGGDLKPGKDGRTLTVYFAGQPQYLIETVPAGGKHSCRVVETINGRRLEKGTTHATGAESLRAGLDDLRDYLGW